MDKNRKLTLRYISQKSFVAVLATSNGHFYSSQFPYISLREVEKVDKSPISKTFQEKEMHDVIFPRAILIMMAEMNDLFIKINNGSIDIIDDAQYKERMLEKIKNNTFLFSGEGRTTIIQWLSLSFLLIKYTKDDVAEIMDVISDAEQNPSFVVKLYKRFGRLNKESFTNKLLDSTLPVMKREKKWGAIRKANFVLCFMAKCYAKDRYSEAKSEYDESIEAFERNTGIDANYSRLQKHTDRFTKNQHFNGKRKKQNKL